MMAMRVTGRDKILTARTVHPEYAKCCGLRADQECLYRSRVCSRTGSIDTADLEKKIDDQTAAVIIQSPNFFGIVEDVKRAAEIAHRHGALLVFIFTEAVSLGLLEPPRDADIVRGRITSFAISPVYAARRGASSRPKKIYAADSGPRRRRNQGHAWESWRSA